MHTGRDRQQHVWVSGLGILGRQQADGQATGLARPTADCLHHTAKAATEHNRTAAREPQPNLLCLRKESSVGLACPTDSDAKGKLVGLIFSDVIHLSPLSVGRWS